MAGGFLVGSFTMFFLKTGQMGYNPVYKNRLENI